MNTQGCIFCAPPTVTDSLSILVESFNPTKIHFGVLEISSSISPEEPYSRYIPGDDCPSRKLKGFEWHECLYLHAEQKLLNYAKENNIDVAAIYTYLDACPANFIEYPAKLVEDGMVHGYNLCYRVMNESD